MLNFKFHVKNYSIFTFQDKEYWLFTRKNMAKEYGQSRFTKYPLPPSTTDVNPITTGGGAQSARGTDPLMQSGQFESYRAETL